MKAHRAPETSFLTVAQLAQRWSVDTDQVRVYAAVDGLQLVELQIPGGSVIGAEIAEAERFEERGNANPRRFNPTERRSLLYLIGVMAAVWCGMDREFMTHPYKLRQLIEGDARSKGIPMLRTAESDANALREALDLLPLPREPESQITPAEQKEAA